MKIMISFCATLLLAVSTPAASDAILAKKGKKIYDGMGACASCHGPKGMGDGPAAVALNPKPRSFAGAEYKYDTDGDGKAGTDADLRNILQNGAMKYGGSPLMPARPDITGKDLDALVAYVRSLEKAQ